MYSFIYFIFYLFAYLFTKDRYKAFKRLCYVPFDVQLSEYLLA